MELEIFKAIVHVLDSGAGAPVFSDRLLDLEGETVDYLATHLEKAYTNDAVKNCSFLEDSAFPPLIHENEDFVQCSKQIASLFFETMRQNPAIPNGDLLVLYATIEGQDCLALLKMNYKTAYAHFYQQIEGQHYNALIKQRTILPPASGKAEESVIINLADGAIKLVEKKYEIDGVKDFYLSTRILQSTQATPERVKLQTVQKAAQQAVKEAYPEQEVVLDSQIANIFCEEAVAGEGELEVARIKERLQEEFPLAVSSFTDELETASLPMEETVSVPSAKIKKMEYQSIKTASGIEMKIPTSLLYKENDVVEFINAPDGTISLLIKGVVL